MYECRGEMVWGEFSLCLLHAECFSAVAVLFPSLFGDDLVVSKYLGKGEFA